MTHDPADPEAIAGEERATQLIEMINGFLPMILRPGEEYVICVSVPKPTPEKYVVAGASSTDLANSLGILQSTINTFKSQPKPTVN